MLKIINKLSTYFKNILAYILNSFIFTYNIFVEKFASQICTSIKVAFVDF